MKKRLLIVSISLLLLLLLGLLYFFRFTWRGQAAYYDIFGGNDLHLASENRELYWFDVRHSNDPNARMFGRIEESFTAFHPDLVLVEGGGDAFEGDRDSAFEDGEISFAAYLAKQGGVPVEDIEPPFPMQIQHLQAKYPPEDIYAMYLIRQISSLQFMPVGGSVDLEEMVLSETAFLKANGLAYTGSTIEEMMETINGYLPYPLDTDSWLELDMERLREINYVYTRENGALNAIYNDTYNYRNLYLVELIGEKQREYDRIYIVMGGRHLVDTKDELQALYSS